VKVEIGALLGQELAGLLGFWAFRICRPERVSGILANAGRDNIAFELVDWN
jgi:hypothetical protein